MFETTTHKTLKWFIFRYKINKINALVEKINSNLCEQQNDCTILMCVNNKPQILVSSI